MCITMYGRKFQPANKSFRLIRSEKMRADYIYQVSSKTFYILKQQLKNSWKIQWELFLEWENFKITSMEFFAVWVLCAAQKWEDNQFNQSYCKTLKMHWQGCTFEILKRIKWTIGKFKEKQDAESSKRGCQIRLVESFHVLVIFLTTLILTSLPC